MSTKLTQILQAVAKGELSPSEAEKAMRSDGLAYCELGHTKLDLHRRKRRGVAEAIYCANKTPEQVLHIVAKLDEAGQNVLCTRVSPEMAAQVLQERPDFEYHPEARVLLKRNEKHAPVGHVLVITAGTSDIPVAEEAALAAEAMGSRVDRLFDVGVAGIHRLFANSDKLDQARVVIVAAGMEGALPSVVAGLVGVPVIAVPTSIGYGASFGGVAALLSMLNACSGGIAVVNIDNGFGAGLMAHLINQSAEPRKSSTP